MPTSVSELFPYKSLILARIRDGVALGPVVSCILDDVEKLLALKPGEARRRVHLGEARRSGDITVGFLHYEEDNVVTWTSDPDLVDTVNHLVLICRRNRHVAIYLSDTKWRRAVVASFDQEGEQGLGALQVISPSLLNAAFVRGRARTLWLSGTHRRTPVKADTKILSGLNLRDALDPLDDQTYYFTAARSQPDLAEFDFTIGVSPRGSRVWIGPTSEWVDFRDTVSQVLGHLESTTEPEDAPLPVVAVRAIDGGDILDAFDVALLPPELLADDPAIDPETRAQMERWAYQGSFEIIETDGPDFSAGVALAGSLLGTLTFSFSGIDTERITWAVEGEAASSSKEDDLEEARTLCARPDWLKVWYDSGHTLSGGAIYRVRHRDIPFPGFSWVDFSQYDVTKEKPDPLADVGNQDSLFCWTKNTWPSGGAGGSAAGGWLACDDGSMEIADFIHLDTSTDPPKICLIHVKAAGSSSSNRGISVSNYEVVTGQAIKNLRFLDRLHLSGGLTEGLGREVSSLVWHDRIASDREAMIEALSELGSNYRRQVVVLQPHVRKDAHDMARANPANVEAARLRQLDTLLWAAESRCHVLSADFLVIASA